MAASLTVMSQFVTQRAILASVASQEQTRPSVRQHSCLLSQKVAHDNCCRSWTQLVMKLSEDKNAEIRREACVTLDMMQTPLPSPQTSPAKSHRSSKDGSSPVPRLNLTKQPEPSPTAEKGETDKEFPI